MTSIVLSKGVAPSNINSAPKDSIYNSVRSSHYGTEISLSLTMKRKTQLHLFNTEFKQLLRKIKAHS